MLMAVGLLAQLLPENRPESGEGEDPGGD
jgi:hypothetical protein